LLAEGGLLLQRKASFKPVHMPNIGEARPRPYQSSEMIAARPDYGHVVCHCEHVTSGEIADAVRAVIPARTMEGVKRRTRAMQGRCQGFHCHAATASMLARETGQSVERLLSLERHRDG